MDLKQIASAMNAVSGTLTVDTRKEVIEHLS